MIQLFAGFVLGALLGFAVVLLEAARQGKPRRSPWAPPPGGAPATVPPWVTSTRPGPVVEAGLQLGRWAPPGDPVCPVHGTPMFYAPSTRTYACQNPDCAYAGGVPFEAL